MKKLVKIAGSLAIIMSLAMSMTGCVLTDVKNKGSEIMGNVFDLKASKVVKSFNEDDDDCDEQGEAFEKMVEYLEDSFELGFEDVAPKAKSTKVNNNDATIIYTISIEDENYDFELALVKDGDDWVISDNEEFIVSVLTLYFDVIQDAGSKSQKNGVKDLMEMYNVKKTGKLAQKMYDLEMA